MKTSADDLPLIKRMIQYAYPLAPHQMPHDGSPLPYTKKNLWKVAYAEQFTSMENGALDVDSKPVFR